MNTKIVRVEINPSYEWQEDAKEVGISHRELEVFALVVKGYSNKEIAEILSIKHQSVKNHLHSLYKKLRVRNSAQALVIAIGKNLIQVEHKLMDVDVSVKFTAEDFIEGLNHALSDENPNLKEKVKKKAKIFLKSRGIDIEI